MLLDLRSLTEAAAGGTITGTASITLADLTLSATGVLPIKGAASITLDDVTLSATGALAIKGASAVTLDDVTLAAAGALAIKGVASVTLDDVTLSATGALPIVGTASITLDDLTLVATGELGAAPAVDETVIDVGGSQRVFRAMHRKENRRKRREQEARERLRATLERAARAIYGEGDPPPEAAAAIAEAREVLADTAPSGVVIAFAEADNLALISAAIRQLEAVMREIEDDEEAAVMMLLAA